MDVFVIPVGPDRYELYCEQPAAEDAPIEPEQPGLFGTLRERFRGLIRAAEERQRAGAPQEPVARGWVGRLQDRTMAWVVERIAEQRLLWNLRGQTAVTAAHPADMMFDEVHTIIRATLQHDLERRRRWMVIDGLVFLETFVALGPLFILIPGVANLPALYFGFRAVGHFLSMRGAAHGLRRVTWSGRPCLPLNDLRGLAALDASAREAHLHDIAARLRLEQLPTFFDRVNRYNSGP
jgi:hypothetical protein